MLLIKSYSGISTERLSEYIINRKGYVVFYNSI